jgi:hypothetical protein
VSQGKTFDLFRITKESPLGKCRCFLVEQKFKRLEPSFINEHFISNLIVFCIGFQIYLEIRKTCEERSWCLREVPRVFQGKKLY